jgi:hypothetical protein
MNRFETADLATSEEDEEKRIFPLGNNCGDTCKLSHRMTKVWFTQAILLAICVPDGCKRVKSHTKVKSRFLGLNNSKSFA